MMTLMEAPFGHKHSQSPKQNKGMGVTLALPRFKICLERKHHLHFIDQSKSHGHANFREGELMQSYYVSRRKRTEIFGNSSNENPK